MVAAKIATLRDGERKSASPIGEAQTTQAEAAALLNVGKRSVERARDNGGEMTPRYKSDSTTR
jgi:hypothetical protein